MASTGEVWKLGHRPALDGVRGVAVLLVLAGHTLLPQFRPYGAAGVDLFFALSGFLITSLLLAEHTSTGRVSFSAFYKRRAARLLPALSVFVAVVTVARSFVDGAGAAMSSAFAVLFYVANWAIIGGANLGYMGHAWSLAVEEQFYLVWPLALLVLTRLPRAARVAVCGTAVALICVWRWFLGSHSSSLLLEQGSVERAAPILMGAGLAFYLAGRRDGRSSPRLAAWLAVALVAVPWIPYRPATEHVGTGLISVGLIVCAARGVGVAWLEWAPLRLVGRRSYALYLWHFPVMIPLMSMLGLTGWQRAVAVAGCLAVSWFLASLSWRYIERPVLDRVGRVGTQAVTEKSSSRTAGDAPFGATT